MRLTYVMPAPELRTKLSVYCDGGTFGSAAQYTVPSLLGQIHMRTSGSSTYAFADGRVVQAPAVAICGPINQAFRMIVSPDFRFVSLGLLPVGWMQLLGFSAGSVADDILDGAAVWPASLLEALLEQLSGESCPEVRAAILDGFVNARLAERLRNVDPRIAAIDHWIETSCDIEIDRLLDRLELSGRQVGRLTYATHGSSPKLLSMKYRALKAAAALAVHGQAAADFVMDGYTDQSHFIRDFRRFVGWTPGAYLRERSSLARDTLYGRWRLGAQRALSLWS